MPRVSGAGAELHVSEVDAIVENNVPLLELPVRAPTPEDEVIGRTIASLVPDGACLQMGVGALPNLVCAELRDRNDLGIHTEALNPGLVDLIRAGVVTNRHKAIDRGKTVFTFAMGQKAMYDFLNDNPAVESAPVDYVNDPRIIARNDNVVSINATIQIDLTGACNSEHMLGHQYSASGGQLDFVRGAYASRGGKSIIAATSTAAKGKISTSRRAARRAGHHAAHRHPVHRHRVRGSEPQGPVVDRTRTCADHARASRIPRRPQDCRRRTASDLMEAGRFELSANTGLKWSRPSWVRWLQSS